jgi:hypothetical protein
MYAIEMDLAGMIYTYEVSKRLVKLSSNVQVTSQKSERLQFWYYGWEEFIIFAIELLHMA